MGKDEIFERNLEVYKREAERSFEILQRNRHRSVKPYEWFGPDPEAKKPEEGCDCSGCFARFDLETTDGNA